MAVDVDRQAVWIVEDATPHIVGFGFLALGVLRPLDARLTWQFQFNYIHCPYICDFWALIDKNVFIRLLPSINLSTDVLAVKRARIAP